MIRNTHKVPRKQWKAWSETARSVFDAVYGGMIADPGLFMHPDAEELEAEHFATTAWNAAWYAAEAVDGNL